jgi:hypothetical protein
MNTDDKLTDGGTASDAKPRNIIVSVSGGRSSHYMAYRMQRDPSFANDRLVYVFANTGKERPETLDFVHKCDVQWALGIVWLEAFVSDTYGEGTTFRRVTYETAAREGEPFESVIRKYSISNAAYPHCTRELKQRPINKYALSVFGDNYTTAIGIRADEVRRIKPRVDRIYPLFQYGVTVAQVRSFWNSASFDLALKDYEGNCDLCWKKSRRKLLTILKERPGAAAWWDSMERKYGADRLASRNNASIPEGAGIVFGRQNESMASLLTASAQQFTPATDIHWKNDFSHAMDDEQPCACMVDEDTAI